MDNDLLEPLKFYETRGRELHNENAQNYFDELLAKSGVNVEENRATVKAYKAEMHRIDKLNKKIRKYKTLRVLTVIGVIAAVIAAIAGVYYLVTAGGWKPIVALCVGLVFAVIGIILCKKKLTPTIKHATEVREKHERRAEELLGQAQEQTAPLNALFDDTDTLKLIEKTVPDFSFDRRFTKDHEALFVKQHDFWDLSRQTTSMTDTLSGRFAGNPFLFCRRRVHEMSTKTYFGTLLITWTEHYRDSKGNMRTRMRSQTLHASVIKPYPIFYTNSYLCYGSQAAPDLSFSRAPQHSEDLTEKQREKKIRKGEKKLQKKAEKALETGGGFQEMANSEFDVLFGAFDRDHEVQFRLMYTPLAQQNTVDLMTSETGYGDDFHFTKRKRCNIITSEHAQSWNMNTSAANYYSYDVDEIKTKFIQFNAAYFKSVFFDFAPLLSVPAYVEEPCVALEEIEDYESNYTYYEHEVMANAIGCSSFAHPQSDTEAILKTSVVHKGADEDKVDVTAFSFNAVERVDFIPVRGGDGKMHAVPVPWLEYIPVERTVPMAVALAEYSEKERRDIRNSGENTLPEGIFFHGMVARPLE